MDKCRDCKRDTHWGSGLFINRIPADDGWLCADCQSIACCHCGELTLDFRFDDNGDAWCPDCVDDPIQGAHDFLSFFTE